MEQPNIHDNFVYAIRIHREQKVLVLHTPYRDGDGPHDFTDVRFSGVIAHHFRHITAPSILFNIEEVTPRWIVRDEWKELFDEGKKCNWPTFELRDPTMLLERIAADGIRGFTVSGVTGVDGFVLAKEVDFLRRSEPYCFADDSSN